MSIQFCVEHGASADALAGIVEKFGLCEARDAPFMLVLTPERLALRKMDEPKLGEIFVDFISGAMAHRRRFGGGRGEAIAKAVGIKGDYLPTVIDGTAGLGRDAFVLASLGCRVHMLERHPVVAALLDNGLQRAYEDSELGSWLSSRLHCTFMGTQHSLTESSLEADVVYLDPMFPHRQKSALVKKEMRVFQQLVGTDGDADSLLAPARKIAKKRVVVKRPDYAPYLADVKPHASLATKNHRFDIYMPET